MTCVRKYNVLLLLMKFKQELVQNREKLLATQYENVRPDIIVLGKALQEEFYLFLLFCE